MLSIVAQDPPSLDFPKDEAPRHRSIRRLVLPTCRTFCTDFAFCVLFCVVLLLGCWYAVAELQRAFEVGYAAGFKVGFERALPLKV